MYYIGIMSRHPLPQRNRMELTSLLVTSEKYLNHRATIRTEELTKNCPREPCIGTPQKANVIEQLPRIFGMEFMQSGRISDCWQLSCHSLRAIANSDSDLAFGWVGGGVGGKHTSSNCSFSLCLWQVTEKLVPSACTSQDLRVSDIWQTLPLCFISRLPPADVPSINKKSESQFNNQYKQNAVVDANTSLESPYVIWYRVCPQ